MALRNAAGSTPGSARREIDPLRAELERLDAEIERLAAAERHLAEAVAAVEVRGFDEASTAAELEAAEHRVESLEAEIEAAKSDDRLGFTLPGDSKRKVGSPF